MADDYIPKTEKEKIAYLMATDVRRDTHYKELKKDIQNVSENVKELTSLIAGTHLNGNKGFFNLVETIEVKVLRHEKDIEDSQRKHDNIKGWGKAVGVVILAIFVVIINYIKEKSL